MIAMRLASGGAEKMGVCSNRFLGAVRNGGSSVDARNVAFRNSTKARFI